MRNDCLSEPDLFEHLERTGFVLLAAVGGLDRAVDRVEQLGPLCPQYDGEYLYDVRARAGFEHLAYTGSCNAIGPHTEAPLWQHPPRYLALYGVRSCAEGGETLLHDMAPALKALAPATRAALQATRIRFSRKNCTDAGTSATRPLLEDGPEPRLRFSHNLFMRGDIDGNLHDDAEAATFNLMHPAARDFVRDSCDAFEREAIAIRIPEDGLLVWDNHRLLHGRTAYQGAERHLVRMWIDGSAGQ